ncbi:MAG: S-adenosylmethionine:tRNA ribosyltransferase-isomerase [Bacteroidetes bacterium]|nr:MAG: S-adenosylmethionine:tRNA ribosyltransferase-isomerase [Bacteroidota bacterium]
MSTPYQIKIEEYNYSLPDDRIAKFPLEQRHLSKLLYLNEGAISEKSFSQIPQLLPSDSLLVFNETKVIQARLLFKKATGASIEIFCLEPIRPVNDFQLAFQQNPPVVWKCLVGNAKRWKSGNLESVLLINGVEVKLTAKKETQLSDSFLISFSWKPEGILFSEILEASGLIPLPPYLHREPVASDKERYQTVYARFDGSVAAPTAGLHFTDTILQQLLQRGVQSKKVTLHVGAGTFKPVSSETIQDHEMHTEKVVVAKTVLKSLLKQIGNPVIPVGTTSMRTIESLFWMALKIKLRLTSKFVVNQWDPYELDIPYNFSSREALTLLIEILEQNKVDELKGETRLMIAPGYRFRLATGLITNFHQPKSTLLLLVSALIGDKWKEAYDFALKNQFRFLSYGDSCLFLP